MLRAGTRHGSATMSRTQKVLMSQTIPRGVRYLALDDDGVPDAVLINEHWPHDDQAGAAVVETLETGIGIDGRPSDISVHAHH